MRHRGQKKTVMAVAHTILVIVYHMLKHGFPYTSTGRPISISESGEAPHVAMSSNWSGWDIT